MSNPDKVLWRNLLSVVAGIAIALVIIIPIGLLGQFLVFSDEPISRLQEILSYVLTATGMIIGALVGGYATARLSMGKKIIPVVFTGIALLCLYLLVTKFDVSYYGTDEIVYLLVIFPSTLIGGYRGIKKKKSAV